MAPGVTSTLQRLLGAPTASTAATSNLANTRSNSSVEGPLFQLKRPTVPVVSNVNALPVCQPLFRGFVPQQLTFRFWLQQTDPKVISSLLVEQAVQPVQWRDSLRYCVNSAGITEFVEIGPAPVLAGFVRQCDFNAAAAAPAASDAHAATRSRPPITASTLHNAESIVKFINTYKD
jgi:hypothetical protein